MAKKQRQKAARAILQARDLLIACHVNPDGDALGSLCALGLACVALGKPVTLVSADGVPDLYQFIPGADLVVQTASVAADVGIGLDADGAHRLGSAAPLVLGANTVIDIDHHVGTERYGQICVVEPEAAATGEIIYDLIQELGAPIDRSIAEALMTAIVTDTGVFRYRNVTPSMARISLMIPSVSSSRAPALRNASRSSAAQAKRPPRPI
jgi:phosphoesterase RecJ-like protein